jgi:hypothetical protein
MTYQAVAATQGDFLLPAIKASVDDQPEVCALHYTALLWGDWQGQQEQREGRHVTWIVECCLAACVTVRLLPLALMVVV